MKQAKKMKNKNQQTQHLPFLIKIGFFSLCGFFSLKSVNAKVENNQPLNIIFLPADDMRHDDMSFVDHNRAITLQLAKPASQAAVFINADATTPICAVSGASILRGKYARRYGIYGFRTPLQGESWQQTYSMELKKVGYKTGFVGKYGINNKFLYNS